MRISLRVLIPGLIGAVLSAPGLALAAGEPAPVAQWRLLSLIEKGGFMMYPILFCSVLIVGIRNNFV